VTFYRILFALDALILLVLGYFFLDGLQYSRAVDTFTIWLPILGGLIGLLVGARALQASDRRRLAVAVLLLPAVPAIFFILFFGLLLAANPNWQ
jgi:uncharacterized membrane protein